MFRRGFFQDSIAWEGLAPRLIEGAKVRYARPFSFADYCGRRYRHGRAYAAKRDPGVILDQGDPACAGFAVRPDGPSAQVCVAIFEFPGGELALGFLQSFSQRPVGRRELMGYVTGRPGDAARLD